MDYASRKSTDGLNDSDGFQVPAGSRALAKGIAGKKGGFWQLAGGAVKLDGELANCLPDQIGLGFKIDFRMDGAACDHFTSECYSRHSCDGTHFHRFGHLPELSGTSSSSVAAASNDHHGLSVSFLVKVDCYAHSPFRTR
jgi:hypothetical protein